MNKEYYKLPNGKDLEYYYKHDPIRFELGCAIKYLIRLNRKEGASAYLDLKKAADYIESLIDSGEIYEGLLYEYMKKLAYETSDFRCSIIVALCRGQFETALTAIKKYIKDLEDTQC